MLGGVIVYTVGQPYQPEHPGPMPETPHLRITGTSLELVIAYRSPTPAETHEFVHGTVRFAWVDSEQVALLAFKLGSLPWADCPFHPRFVVEAGMTPPRLVPDSGGKVLPMIFVDAATGLVAAIRLIGLPAQFVTAMAVSVSRMLLLPYDVAAHDAALDALYTRYDTSAQLVQDRADITCVGAKPDSVRPGTGVDAS